MYNNPKRIKKVSDDVIEKMGWERLTNFGLDENTIQNTVRATIRPNDTSEERIFGDVMSQLDRRKKRKFF